MPSRHRAFTLLELLVSIGIIALLISLVVVSMKGVRAAAARTESLSALRGMMRGYLTYSTDHRQRLLPGFLGREALEQLQVKVTLENGTTIFDASAPAAVNNANCTGEVCDASPYVWRLLPYIDNSRDVLLTDYASESLEEELRIAYEAGRYGAGSATPSFGDIGLGLVPAYGLNSIFLGGDTYHGDAETLARNPFDPVDPDDVIAATTTTEVLNPARITVFAAAVQPTDSDLYPEAPNLGEIRYGYPEIRAPFLQLDEDGEWNKPQWFFNDAGRIEGESGAFGDGGGWPIGRNGEEDVPLAHLDGSTEVVRIYELGLSRDLDTANARREVMSRWWPGATGVR